MLLLFNELKLCGNSFIFKFDYGLFLCGMYIILYGYSFHFIKDYWFVAADKNLLY